MTKLESETYFEGKGEPSEKYLEIMGQYNSAEFTIKKDPEKNYAKLESLAREGKIKQVVNGGNKYSSNGKVFSVNNGDDNYLISAVLKIVPPKKLDLEIYSKSNIENALKSFSSITGIQSSPESTNLREKSNEEIKDKNPKVTWGGRN